MVTTREAYEANKAREAAAATAQQSRRYEPRRSEASVRAELEERRRAELLRQRQERLREETPRVVEDRPQTAYIPRTPDEGQRQRDEKLEAEQLEAEQLRRRLERSAENDPTRWEKVSRQTPDRKEVLLHDEELRLWREQQQRQLMKRAKSGSCLECGRKLGLFARISGVKFCRKHAF
jgi:hypothetical protein